MARTVRPVTLADRDRVVRHLEHVFPHFDASTWGLLFDYGHPDPPDYGLLSETESGEIVAYFGALYSDRVIEGRPVRFANASSYSVREDQRGKGVGSELALAYVKHMHDMGYPLTILSSGAGGMAFWQENGFEPICLFREVRFPVPPLVSALTGRLPKWVEVQSVTPEHVGEEAHRILEYHQGRYCTVGVLREGDAYCVLVTRRRIVDVERPGWMKSLAVDSAGRSLPVKLYGRVADLVAGTISTTEIAYASDWDFVRRYRNGVAMRVTLRDRTLALSGPDELLGLKPPDRPARVNEYMAVTEGLDRSAFDIAYSELLVLPFV